MPTSAKCGSTVCEGDGPAPQYVWSHVARRGRRSHGGSLSRYSLTGSYSRRDATYSSALCVSPIGSSTPCSLAQAKRADEIAVGVSCSSCGVLLFGSSVTRQGMPERLFNATPHLWHSHSRFSNRSGPRAAFHVPVGVLTACGSTATPSGQPSDMRSAATCACCTSRPHSRVRRPATSATSPGPTRRSGPRLDSALAVARSSALVRA